MIGPPHSVLAFNHSTRSLWSQPVIMLGVRDTARAAELGEIVGSSGSSLSCSMFSATQDAPMFICSELLHIARTDKSVSHNMKRARKAARRIHRAGRIRFELPNF